MTSLPLSYQSIASYDATAVSVSPAEITSRCAGVGVGVAVAASVGEGVGEEVGVAFVPPSSPPPSLLGGVGDSFSVGVVDGVPVVTAVALLVAVSVAVFVAVLVAVEVAEVDVGVGERVAVPFSGTTSASVSVGVGAGVSASSVSLLSNPHPASEPVAAESVVRSARRVTDPPFSSEGMLIPVSYLVVV